MTVSARIDHDAGTITLCKGAWSGTFHVTQLPDQLKMYRGLRDRKGGAYAASYRDTVKELERVEKALEAQHGS